jgi:O-antigen ligase
MIRRFSTVGDILQGRVDGITFERLYIYDLALRGWLENPVLGWGAGTFGQKYTYLSQDIPAWVGNLELHALYDSGVIGLAGLGTAMLGTVFRAARVAGKVTVESPVNKGVIAGLLGACVTLLVAFQATEATWLGYTWYVFGLTWAAAAPAWHQRSLSVHSKDRRGREGNKVDYAGGDDRTCERSSM